MYILRHPNRLQGFVHALANFLWRNAQIFRPECYVFFHNRGYQLVVRVLKHHPYATSQPINIVLRDVFIGNIPAINEYFARSRLQNKIQKLGERRFSRSVVSQHRHIFTFFNGKRDVPHSGRFFSYIPGFISIRKMLGLDK